MTNVTGVIFVRVWFYEPKNAPESGEVSTYCVAGNRPMAKLVCEQHNYGAAHKEHLRLYNCVYLARNRMTELSSSIIKIILFRLNLYS